MTSPRPVLVVSLACSALAFTACGGSDAAERKLIAQSRADALVRSVDEIEVAITEGDCPAATAGVDPLRAQVERLPEATDDKLVANLAQWVDHLQERVPADCEAPAEEPTETPAPTEAPEETPTPSPTPTETPDETATPAPTPDDTQTPAPTPTPGSGDSDGSGNGGASPEEEG